MNLIFTLAKQINFVFFFYYSKNGKKYGNSSENDNNCVCFGSFLGSRAVKF